MLRTAKAILENFSLHPQQELRSQYCGSCVWIRHGSHVLHEITTNTKLKDGIWKNSDLKTSIVRLYKGFQSWARVLKCFRVSRLCVFFRLPSSLQQNPFCIGCAETRKCSRPPSSEGILIKVTKWDHEDNPHLHGRGAIWYSQLWMATSPEVPMYKNSESICIPSPK